MDNIEQIQKSVKEKFGVDISEEEIEAIITAQSRITKWGIENEQDVYWIYFGKFKIKTGRKGALEKNKDVQENLRNINQKPNNKQEIRRIGIGNPIPKDINKFGEGEDIIKIEM